MCMWHKNTTYYFGWRVFRPRATLAGESKNEFRTQLFFNDSLEQNINHYVRGEYSNVYPACVWKKKTARN